MLELSLRVDAGAGGSGMMQPSSGNPGNRNLQANMYGSLVKCSYMLCWIKHVSSSLVVLWIFLCCYRGSLVWTQEPVLSCLSSHHRVMGDLTKRYKDGWWWVLIKPSHQNSWPINKEITTRGVLILWTSRLKPHLLWGTSKGLNSGSASTTWRMDSRINWCSRKHPLFHFFCV